MSFLIILFSLNSFLFSQDKLPQSFLKNLDGEKINKHIGYNPGDEINLEKEIVELLETSIRSDTILIDTSIINILKSIEESKKEDAKVLPLIETQSE